MNRGRLIVIDGIDGSGKTTQVELLKEYLASQGLALEVISFPRYGENVYAELVSRYLVGEFGGIGEINPYFLALAFAGDRALSGPQIKEWLEDGKLVVANRYVSASKAHLGASLPDEKRQEFFYWLDQLEYETNRIPKEDLTILLNVDPQVGQKNVAGGDQPDIHEDSLRHLEEASKIYLFLAKSEANWYVVDCMKGEKMKSPEDIYRDIQNILEKVK